MISTLVETLFDPKKNLYINLINVEDIIFAVKLICEKNIKSDRYLLKNIRSYKIDKIINNFNKKYSKKIKVKYISNTLIKEKTLSYNEFKSWKPLRSNITDIIENIKK